MIPLTTLHLAHLPPDLAVHIALCRELQNGAFLRQQLLAGNAEFEYALLDASSILSPTHLHAAIFRAATDAQAQRLKTHNVHAEIVFALSANNNVHRRIVPQIRPDASHHRPGDREADAGQQRRVGGGAGERGGGGGAPGGAGAGGPVGAVWGGELCGGGGCGADPEGV
ncbi:hypothetical protein MMC17_007894 [Xylographa soralifera]|nr:hypothetical protein [Xylographa soralifera]